MGTNIESSIADCRRQAKRYDRAADIIDELHELVQAAIRDDDEAVWWEPTPELREALHAASTACKLQRSNWNHVGLLLESKTKDTK